MRNESTWFGEIGYLRAFAVIGVVLSHVAGILLARPDLIVLNLQKGILIVFYAFTSLSVPIFIFISGFVLYNKYADHFSLSKFYKRRFSAVLPPYLIFTTFYSYDLYVLVAAYVSVFHQLPISASNTSLNSGRVFSQYLNNLAFGYVHLWFFIVLLQLYLLFPLLVQAYNRVGTRSPLYFLIPFFALQCVYPLLNAYVESGSQFSGLLRWLISFVPYVLYFVLGFVVREHYLTIKSKVENASLSSIALAVTLATAGFSVVTYYYKLVLADYGTWLYWIMGPFYCVLLIVLYLKIGIGYGEPHDKFTRYMQRIGENAFGIFLVHWLFLFVFRYAFLIVGLDSYIPAYTLLFFSALALLTLISSDLSVQVLYRLPFSNVIIGEPRRRKASAVEAPETPHA